MLSNNLHLFLCMICLLVFPLFISIVDAFSSSLWGLGEFLFKYSFHPYGDLEDFCLNTLFIPILWGLRGKILFSSLRGLRGFLLKYYLCPYLDDIHPFKESYHLFGMDDVHPFKESYRLFHLDDLFGLLRRK